MTTPKNATNTDGKGALHEPELDSEEGKVSLPSTRSNVRIFVRQSILERLVKLGVPDDLVDLTEAVNEILDISLNRGTANITTSSDLVVMLRMLAVSIRELNATNMGMSAQLAAATSTVEHHETLIAFRKMLQARIKKP